MKYFSIKLKNNFNAVSWETKEYAQSWADQFGGEVVEFQSPPAPPAPTHFDSEVVGLELDGDDVIVSLRVPNARPFANRKWGFTTKMRLEVVE